MQPIKVKRNEEPVYVFLKDSTNSLLQKEKNGRSENKFNKCFMGTGRNEIAVRLLELRTQRTLSSGAEGHRFSSQEGKIQAHFICCATALK